MGLRSLLGARSVVLVGLMGAGKTTIGRRLASRLGMPFRDADAEIETAAGMPISDYFATYGEGAFREGERRVIDRLLAGAPLVLATGGGAYMNPATRGRVAEVGVAVWLRADHETLMRRVRRRSHRPLLQNPDPDGTMQRLMEERYPVYGLAPVIVDTHDAPLDQVVGCVVESLHAFVEREERGS